MTFLAAARRWIANTTRTGGMERRREIDPADMGTAFGLDAITTLERESVAPTSATTDRPWSPFEPRPPRRSVF